jgi:hypothetical protein
LEGPTEVAFFEALAEHWGVNLHDHGIILYDLKGKDGLDTNQVLSQLLQKFQSHEVFAFAALDEDGGGDHVRILKRLAGRGVLSAGFRIWVPDFESHNFSLDEIALAATRLAKESNPDIEFTVEEILNEMNMRSIPAGKAIERLASRKRVRVDKGTDWGKTLAEIVCADGVEVPEEIRNEEGDRPAISMLSMLIRGHDADYALSVEHTMSQHGQSA